MVSRRTNFGERSELAPYRGGKLQSAGGGGGGGAAQSNVSPLAGAKKTCTHHQFGHASSTNLTNFSSIPCYEKFSQF